jgi:hypothetical protein
VEITHQCFWISAILGTVKHLISLFNKNWSPCLPRSLAFWHVGAEGKETKLTYSQLDLASQKAANVLARKGILQLQLTLFTRGWEQLCSI